MGVRGLTSFIAKSHTPSTISHKLVFPFQECETKQPLIIDGSSLFYHLFFASADWLNGGTMVKFSAYLKSYMTILKLLGYECHVCIDGVMPEAKLGTCLEREEDKIKRVMKAQRSVLAGDTTYRTMDGFMPYLAYQAAMITLAQEQVSFEVCWSEGDKRIAYLAKERQAMILSKDSDFFIFPSAKGYIPLYGVDIPKSLMNMFWGAEMEEGAEFTVNMSVFHRADVAQCLGIDEGFMPLLAGLSGNDYGTSAVVDQFLSKAPAPPGISANRNLTPHDRLNQVVAWLRQQTELGASTVVAAEEISTLLEGQGTDGMMRALTYYSIDETTTAPDDSELIQAFTQGAMPPMFMTPLTSGTYLNSVRWSALDAPSPCGMYRTLRSYILYQLSSMVPVERVTEWIRRGYNYSEDELSLAYADLIGSNKMYASWPEGPVVSGETEQRLQVLSIFTSTPKEVITQDSALILALRMLIKHTSAFRSSASPKLSETEVASLVMSAVYVDEGGSIMKPPQLPGTTKKGPIKKKPTTFSLRGVLRAAQWQVTCEHFIALLQTLRLTKTGASTWGENVVDTSLMATCYHGPLLHFCFDKLRSATPHQLLTAAGVSSEKFDCVFAAVTQGLTDDIDSAPVAVKSVTPSQKKAALKSKKEKVQASNIFDLLGDA
jgi:hypothetical protein